MQLLVLLKYTGVCCCFCKNIPSKMAEKDPKRSKQDSAYRTRSVSTNWYLGTLLSELKEDKLPITLDVLRYYQHRKETEFGPKISKSEKNSLCTEVSVAVMNIWKKASIFTIRKVEDVKKKLIREVDKLQYLLDTSHKHAGDADWIDTKNYVNNFYSLFDIALCKCYDKIVRNIETFFYEPEEVLYKNCTCPVNQKIPENEWAFYVDQKLTRSRKMFIDQSIDIQGSKTLNKQLEKAEQLAKKSEKLEKQKEREKALFDQPGPSTRTPRRFSKDDAKDSSDSNSEIDSSSEDEDHKGDGSDEDYEEKVEAKYCKWQYPNTVSFAQRHGLTLFQICGMINMVLRDLVVTDHSKFVSIKKIRNMKQKQGRELADEHALTNGIRSITYDGKKNSNVQEHSKTILQENITVISEPNGTYLHHFTPKSGSGKDIGVCLYDTVLEYQSQDTLLSVGADSTAANTSPDKGAIHYLELNMRKCLQWIIWDDSSPISLF